MARIVDVFRNLFVKRRGWDSESAEELRNAFQARYHRFRLLLNANNKALDIMAEVEEALTGHRPFGMTFIQSRCTAVSTNVWKIVKTLNDLAPGKYEGLFERFREIQRNINQCLLPKMSVQEGPLVLPLEEADKDRVDLVGGKLANLGEVKKKIHLNLPDGFAITAQAYDKFLADNDLQAEIDRRIQAANVERPDQLYSLNAALQQLIIGSPVPGDLERAVREHYRLLADKHGRGIRVAVRSSALGEDFTGTSFAGQYRTILNVSGENILQAYKEVLASKYSLQAMTYRLTRGIRDEDVAMSVGCMCMVDALSGGVVYSRNPVNIRDDTIVINSAWGLPKSVVDGITTPDIFIISRNDPMVILNKEIAAKEQKYTSYPEEGIFRQELTAEENQSPSLSDEQALDLARLAVRLEKHFGLPQDIEWAIEKDRSITILQCRPLKQMDRPATPEENASNASGDRPIIRDGTTASPGVASGPVFTLVKDADALKFPHGSILVTRQALPRWATMLNRAAAVVTERGSVAGHLANVAREYNIPSLFGVRDALRKLRTGQLITVDADGHCIYKDRVESLLSTKEKPRNLMEGSPVFEALKEAAAHITPLTLLDPDAPRFRPKNCRTLHDITRFCHEKSVQEMFRFGKEHHFPERSSKQLICEIPMQWWILNLDDGFKEEVSGAHVRLDTIVSIPMLALWEGIVASPWKGPPPVDGKGFLSVMFEATKNTSLVPGVRSRYADRNYFMISRNYCSLNSRLGFHFSSVEALVSKRSGENYISFQFKGGAADTLRRRKRTLFISEILEGYGFKVEVNEDHLAARLENHDMDYMKKCLKILGYLTIHTRQLDMIMSNAALVDHYRKKINWEIQEMFDNPDTENS